MFRLLFRHFVPASLYGVQTAFAALSKIDAALRRCPDTGAAVAVLEKSKADLYTLLRKRFESPVAEAVTLKILNICLARYHFQARSTSVLSRPFGLVVDPSNMCQLACPGCVHSAGPNALNRFDWPNGTVSEERFTALMKLYGPHAIGVYFCNYGEPLLNLATPKLIRRAKCYLMGTSLSTSLSARRFDAEAYVESGLDFMVLSIDGATQRVYEQFRRNGELELVLHNTRKLVEARRRLGRRTPVLSWNYLAFEHNAHEIPAAARVARRLGVDVFRVVKPFDVSWDDPEVRVAEVKTGVRRLNWRSLANLPENWNPFPDSIDGETIARAFESPWDGFADDDAPVGPGHTCHWLYKNIVMDSTGRILPCCGAPRPDANLVFATFDGRGGDPFNSEKYRRARAHFSTGAPPSEDAPYCTRCEWDHAAVNIGGPEIRRYFRAADASFFDRRSVCLLGGW